MKRTQTELRDKTGNPIDRVSDAREMKLPIIIQQVNDDTAKKKKKRLQSRKYSTATAEKNHATQPKCSGLPQSTWLLFSYFFDFISHLLFNFLDFTVVMEHMLFSFPLSHFFFSLLVHICISIRASLTSHVFDWLDMQLCNRDANTKLRKNRKGVAHTDARGALARLPYRSASETGEK